MYFLEKLAAKINHSHHAKDVMLDIGEDDVCEKLESLLGGGFYCGRNRETRLAERKRRKKEKQDVTVKDTIRQLIKNRIKNSSRKVQDPKKWLRDLLKEVLSGKHRIGWVRALYSKHRTEKIL